MPTVDLPLGPVEVDVFGPDTADTPTAVFVHGFLVSGTLWHQVAKRLAESGIRSVVPAWPLGAHRLPVPAESVLSPATVGQAVLDLLDALDLHDVVLVGNDTGGAICQLALAGDRRRIGALVLTNCDAFETFPPTFFLPLFVLARFRPAVWLVAQTTRLRALRHSPLAFGPLLRRPRPASLTRAWMQPAIEKREIRRDITRFARGIRRTELVDSARWLGTFDRPTRVVWGLRDRHFTPALGRRLAAAIPTAQVVEVPEATTFVSIDRPDPVADAIRAVLAEARGAMPSGPAASDAVAP